MRVRVAAVAGDRVDRLDLLGAELEQQPLRLGHDLALVTPGAAARRSAHRRRRRSGGVVEQRDLLVGLDRSRAPASPASRPRSRLPTRCSACSVTMSVMSMPSGSPAEPALTQLVLDRARRARPGRRSRPASRRASARRRRGSSTRAARARTAGGAGRPSRSPTAPGRPRAEQHEPRVLVARPLADVGARHVADVVRVEQQQRPELGGAQRRPGTSPDGPRAVGEVDPLLPVDRHRGAAGRDI